MVLYTSVDPFCHNQKKCVAERVKIAISDIAGTSVIFGGWKWSWRDPVNSRRRLDSAGTDEDRRASCTRARHRAALLGNTLQAVPRC